MHIDDHKARIRFENQMRGAGKDLVSLFDVTSQR